MVGNLERICAFGGLAILYSYGVFKFTKTKSQYTKKFHNSLVLQGKKFEIEENNKNLKFVDLSGTEIDKAKALFIFGIDNINVYDNNTKTIDRLIESFSPNYFLYEKDLN